MTIVDTATNAAVTTVPLPDPDMSGVASPDGTKVYVANSAIGSIDVIDTVSNTVIQTITTATGAINALAITPNGAKLYLSNQSNDTITVVSTTSGTMTTAIALPQVKYMAITPDGRQLITANLNNTVTVIDTATDTISATIQTGLEAQAFAISLDGKKAYLGGLGLDPKITDNEEQVAVIDIPSQTVVAKFDISTLFPSIVGLAVSPDGSRLYMLTSNGTMTVYLTSTNQVIDYFQLFTQSVREVALNPNGTFLYVEGQDFMTYSDSVAIVDTESGVIIGRVPGLTPTNGYSFDLFFGPPRGSSKLNVSMAGNGSGQVTTSPTGISCPSSCSASFATSTLVTLTATATQGSFFAGWSGGGCSGIETCSIPLIGDTAVTANFVTKASTSIALAAAVLPGSRSVQAGLSATVFGTIINAGPGTATNCYVAPTSFPYASFSFQTTDSATNLLTGVLNGAADIPAGKSQSFVLAFTPTTTFTPQDVALTFACSNANGAPSYSGVNTVLLSSSATQPLDVIGLVATATNDGILHLSAGGSGAFALAAVNVGSAGTVIAVVDTGQTTLPLNLSICQTDPTTGICFQTAGQTTSASFSVDETATYSVFASATGVIPLQAAANRVYVRFMDSAGVVRGSTSVAVTTQ